jgi:hypothetical protein
MEQPGQISCLDHDHVGGWLLDSEGAAGVYHSANLDVEASRCTEQRRGPAHFVKAVAQVRLVGDALDGSSR